MLWRSLCRIDQRVGDLFNTDACRNRDAILLVRSQLLQIMGVSSCSTSKQIIQDTHKNNYRSLLAAWLAALGGAFEEAGILCEIIQQADGLSVVGNLVAARQTTLLPCTRQPLHERLLTGLRFLLVIPGF